MDAYHKGRLDQAQDFLTRSIEQNPNDPSTRENLAKTLSKNGHKDEALVQMQYAVDLSKGDPRIIVELGEMYLESHQWIPAKRQLDLALAADPWYAPAWCLSGRLHKSKKNYDQALADFQRALGFSPDMPDVQMLIVDTYQQMGRPHSVLSATDQILIRHPTSEPPEQVVLAKSVALIELNQLGPAIDLLQTASQKKHASSEVYARLSQAQLQSGQVSEARVTLGRGREAFPNLAIFDRLFEDLQSAEQRVASANNLYIR